MKTAIVFGATGLIGGFLLRELLEDASYERVIAVVRKKPELEHPKLRVLTGDRHMLPQLQSELRAEDVFIALGTTRDKTPDQEEYYGIDHDYPVLAAKLLKDNGARSLSVVTAVGADPRSPFFYVRTKGETERDLLLLDYERTHIFRPSMLLGERAEHRPLEKSFMAVWPVVEKVFVGGMSRYRGIQGAQVARAMVRALKTDRAKIKIYHWSDMR